MLTTFNARPLTCRELDITLAVARGLSNRQIAGEFKLSEQTVKNHLTGIYHKLGMRSRVQLALFALRQDLVPVPVRMDVAS
jgi:DNA-binding NarL/FixJ family response regulator